MIVETETRWGRWRVPNTDVYIGWSLMAYGEFSPAEWRFLCSMLRPNDRVLDVGCNVGAIAGPIVAAGCFVEGFEPQTLLAELADYNVREAGKRPGAGVGTVRACAVGATAGVIQVPVVNYDVQNNFGGISLIPATAAKWATAFDRGMAEVPVVTIDEVNEGRPVALLKADVEGMELDVVRGAERTLAESRPLLYLEADRPDAAQPLLDALIALDYRWHWHRPPLFTPDNFRRFPHCLPHLERTVSLNVVAVPRERPLYAWEVGLAVVDT